MRAASYLIVVTAFVWTIACSASHVQNTAPAGAKTPLPAVEQNTTGAPAQSGIKTQRNASAQTSAPTKPQTPSRDERAARAQARLEQEVRHELVLLPYYSVFDNLAFRVDGDRVTLLGQTVRPTLKSDAEHVVKKIEGVASVDNQIEVLPVSPNDDRIRLAVYRAIYSEPMLQRYALSAVPSIHIIVKNGHVTLEGVTATEAEKNVANIRANGIPGVFSVTNNLRVEHR